MPDAVKTTAQLVAELARARALIATLKGAAYACAPAPDAPGTISCASVIESLPIPIFVKDISGRYIDCNQAFSDLLKMPRDAIVGKTVFDISPLERARVYDEMDRQLYRDGGIQYYESDVRGADGETRYVLFRKVLFTDSDGNVAGLVGEVSDITGRKREEERRKQVEEALRLSEERFRAIIEQSQDVIIVHDAKGEILDVNPKACAVLRCDRQGLLRMNAGDFNLDLLSRLKQSRKPLSSPIVFETEARRCDGDVAHLEVSLSNIHSKDSDAVLVVGRDISERKELESLKEDIDRITRHDLKSLLNGIICLPQLLLDSQSLGPGEREMVEMVLANGKKLLALINDPLDMYKMEQGSYPLKRSELDVLPAIRAQAVETLGKYHEKKLNFELTVDGEPAGPEATFALACEERLFETMLANLLLNAAEASPPGETIKAILTTSTPTLRLRNQGEVPLRIRGRFFEKYATAGKRGGTGLGTYSAALIAKTHGWSINVVCTIPGQTEVSVRFA